MGGEFEDEQTDNFYLILPSVIVIVSSSCLSLKTGGSCVCDHNYMPVEPGTMPAHSRHPINVG